MDNLNELLRYDGISAAERLTGQHWSENEDTALLGAALVMRNGEMKETALKTAGDTYMSQPLDEYLQVVDRLGFRLLNRVPFQNPHYEHEEFLYFFWHDLYSILLSFDTWGGNKSVNGGKFKYCVKPQLADDGWMLNQHFYSSGVLRTLPDGAKLWQGDHDCREGLANNIKNLLSTAEFQKIWADPGFIWPFHYGDEDRHEHSTEEFSLALFKERIGQHPDVLAAMQLSEPTQESEVEA